MCTYYVTQKIFDVYFFSDVLDPTIWYGVEVDLCHQYVCILDGCGKVCVSCFVSLTDISLLQALAQAD